jgi:hypothetical protein
MSVDQIATEALRLPEKEHASLASRLLRSLPPVAFDAAEGVAEARGNVEGRMRNVEAEG